MATTATTLNGAISANATLIKLTAFSNPSAGGIGPQTIVKVDGEQMLVTSTLLAPTLQVVRGYAGTLAGPHNTLAPAVYGLTTDFQQANTGTIAQMPQATYSVDGAFTNPTVDQVVYIDKAGVCALTLSDPAADSQVTVQFVSLTANAHTLTYSTGFYDNTTSSDVATFPSTAGAVFTIKAQSGKWRPVATADDGVTIA
jgi:hypothetical protein